MAIDKAQLMVGMTIKPAYCAMDIDAATDLEAIEILAKNLVAAGAVKESFIPAIIKREREYCTGLLFDDMGIAIPHTDAEHVNEASVAIGVLKNPIMFQSMGMPDIPCKVEMLFMLAIKEPHSQLKFLQTLMQTFQTPGRLTALKACKTAQEATELFQSYFD